MFVNKNFISNDALWATTRLSPKNSNKSGSTSFIVGAFFTSLSLMPLIFVIYGGILIWGLTYVTYSLTFSKSLYFTAATCTILSLSADNPVVSKSMTVKSGNNLRTLEYFNAWSLSIFKLSSTYFSFGSTYVTVWIGCVIFFYVFLA